LTCPMATFPLWDTNGAWANVNQPNGPVFFLVGQFGPINPTQERSFAVPEDKYLLFPVANAWADNVGVDPPLLTEELFQWVSPWFTARDDLRASVDGVAVTNLSSHRAIAPVFSIDFKDNDNFEGYLLGSTVDVVGRNDPVVSDGYWLMLEPLSLGPHLIKFAVYRTNDFGDLDYYLDITDHITVVPVPLTQRVAELVAGVQGSELSPAQQKPLLRLLEAAKAAFASGNVKGGIRSLQKFQKTVRHLAPDEPALAEEFSQAAQRVIERARRDLP
jgi:hypothetical protein